jgi:hypothetical protein
MTQDDQAEYGAMWQCIVDNNVGSLLDAAIECPDEISACWAEDDDDQNCSEIATCTNGCGNDSDCTDTCYNDGTPDGQSEYIALIYCISHYCPNWNNGCVSNVLDNQCQAFSNACFN